MTRQEEEQKAREKLEKLYEKSFRPRDDDMTVTPNEPRTEMAAGPVGEGHGRDGTDTESVVAEEVREQKRRLAEDKKRP